MKELYNLFFYPNVCHVCKVFGTKVKLKKCGNCKMISYCGKSHQKQHWLQHKDLCKGIRKVKQSYSIKTPEVDQQIWTRKRMNFMLLVGLEINRSFQPYEEQMFKFPKACCVCHIQNDEHLMDCENCLSTSFCPQHENHHSHKRVCPYLKLCFDLDLQAVKQTFEHVIPNIDNIPSNLNNTPLPRDMKNFIDSYIESSSSSSSSSQTAFCSEYLSRPLTLLNAMEKLDFCVSRREKSMMTIHVVGANIIEIHGMEMWEIVLHWLTNLSSLTVVFVGPEVPCGYEKFEICEDCSSRNKVLNIETYSGVYERYTLESSFEEPDFIVAYNAGIHENIDSSMDTWSPSLKSIAEQNCPFVVTAYTLQEIEKENNRINEIFKGVPYKYCSENAYSSLRPYRDFESEDIFYQNQYLLIYESLI